MEGPEPIFLFKYILKKNSKKKKRMTRSNKKERRVNLISGNSIYYSHYFVFAWLENTRSRAKTCSCNKKFV